MQLSKQSIGFLHVLKVKTFNQAYKPLQKADLPPEPEDLSDLLLQEGGSCLIDKVGVTYSLTHLGAAFDVSLADIKPEPETPVCEGQVDTNTRCANFTAQWLGENYTEVVETIQKRLSWRYRRSVDSGQFDDHVQQFLMVLIRRDALQKRLDEGKPITVSCIVSWAGNNFSSQIRDSARRPLTRLYMGALLPHERKAKEDEPLETVPLAQEGTGHSQLCLQAVDRTTEVSKGDWMVSSETPDVADAKDHCLAVVEGILEDKNVSDLDFKLDVWQRWHTLGCTIREIAAEKGVEPRVASKHLKAVKAALDERRLDVVQALRG